jgi:hypothetical protein
MVTIDRDIDFFTRVLPANYCCKDILGNGTEFLCKCTDGEGISDDEHWLYICEAIYQRFRNRLTAIELYKRFNRLTFSVLIKKQ